MFITQSKYFVISSLNFHIYKANIAVNFEKGNVVCGDIEEVIEPVRALCRNREYGCPESVNYMEDADHEETCVYAPCACPLQGCSFVGSSEQLSLHFSSKHWDCGRHFQYNCPIPVSLHTDEQFVVLQAEEDGLLFLLNKGIENIGYALMITCIGPSSSKERFFYDLVSERGINSLRLKSCAHSFPGRLEGLPPADFLLIPFSYLGSSGQLNLEVCIWNS
ncbi:E3 ubiquitin-protein ligase SINA-like 10 [Actinidia eriantha]|uniref:E3 ubiquitin-protein ligase SINA-like 10 n=1 Tax=Actinidia eriantha TaxID=165200 RepID=UPI00258FB411|nr:E3 ubiquitin-protein ligase SINA-like 10 [Actinidia eriantha]